jgi:hypothetical protein
LLTKTGHRAEVGAIFENVIRWIGDRYDPDNLGLAGRFRAPGDDAVGVLLEEWIDCKPTGLAAGGFWFRSVMLQFS